MPSASKPKSRSGRSSPRRVARSSATTPTVEDADSDIGSMKLDAKPESEATILDKPLPDEFCFKPKETVWILVNERWISGRIFLSTPRIRPSDNQPCWNVLYQDKFGHRLRKYFAPLLGEMKPDTAMVRQMLQAAH
ncbi:hypothetical protein HMN09_00884800 [Mycena chlorophos]|uniref:Uncharacterized protein n=1 Tax=Mycena chlorophos TaxID=658473 RepID=A0A8H6W1X4_MYCCL|nr:hypothetical protein HMN09_00884800 [Mycena chlorophos]